MIPFPFPSPVELNIRSQSRTIVIVICIIERMIALAASFTGSTILDLLLQPAANGTCYFL